MEVKANLTNRTLEALVETISRIMDLEPVASESPEGSYAIGGMNIAPDGTITFSEDTSEQGCQVILDYLAKNGFLEAFLEEQPAADTESPNLPRYTEDAGRLVIHVPLAGFTSTSLDNLTRLIYGKGTLLKKAVETHELPIENDGITLGFPWFKTNASPDDVAAYMHLVDALCDMAKRQTRVLTVDRPVENEKYAMRCFLLRLGMIGEEYATTRKILLRNFFGNGSMKSATQKRPPERPAPPLPAATLNKPRPLWKRWFKKQKKDKP